MSGTIQSHDKLLHLVEEVEHEYRTVLQAPENDENLQKLHEIGEKIISLQPETDNRQKLVLDLLEKGYDALQISKHLGVSKRHVQRLLQKNNLKVKPNFAYKVTDQKGDNLMFSNNLKSIFSYFALSSHLSNKRKVYELQKNGLFIKSEKEKYCWCDVPEHALYYYKSKWYMKRKNNCS